MRRLAILLCGLLLATNAGARLLDDFHDATPWLASASDQVKASLRRDADGSLCLDHDFAGVSGYAVMRRELPMQWPEHFDLLVRLKARGGGNDVQVKLVDGSGDNVWWMNRPNANLPATLQELRIRQRHISFAWGPATDHSLRETRFVEFVVAAGRRGGAGSLCIARLEMQARAADPAVWPEPQQRMASHRLDIDFGLAREFNGVLLSWPPGAQARDYDLLASDDARRWRRLRSVRGGDGGVDALFLPESEARHLRVQHRRGTGQPSLELRTAANWPDRNAMVAELARHGRRGDLPRAFVGEQNYWTLVGVDGGGARSGLISEDGAIELGRGGPSIEPSLQTADGQRIRWSDVQIQHTLRDGYLPLPSVQWQSDDFTLTIDAAADGPRARPDLLARYTLHNRSAQTQTLMLLLALRPWQVNPPQQFLATRGGVSRVESLAWREGVLEIGRTLQLRPTERPQRAAALPFDGGLSLDALEAAPELSTLHDPQSHASAALNFRVTLPAGGRATVGWVLPLGASRGSPQPLSAAALDRRFDQAAASWRERLNRVSLKVPAAAQPLVDTLRTSLAHILMSRDGPALQPGTRSYERSWIRDGAMMVAGLLRLGETDAAREFVDWYAGFVFASGKVPCCVDHRGADPVVENDSHGQYLYALAELWRHTQDRALLQRHWPQVQRVVAWLEALRQQERGQANRTPQRAHLFGLLPPSISHEGYSDKPAYAYWDDFWALRGYKDAVIIARAVGDDGRAATWSGWRDQFQQELNASIAATALRHGIQTIAGAADRGDFDATSTTVALNPAQADVPRTLLDATFEHYWQESLARSEGRRRWKDYTPYELRSVGALVRLGRPERAHAMLDFFFGHQRPAGWNQWAEVVLPDAREPRFLGDMPHAWVSSDYIRSALDLFAFDRESDGQTVIGAGLAAQWLAQGDIEVRGLSTAEGALGYRLLRHPRGWQLHIDQGRMPLRLAWPAELPLPRAEQGGLPLTWSGRELALPPAPAMITLHRD